MGEQEPQINPDIEALAQKKAGEIKVGKKKEPSSAEAMEGQGEKERLPWTAEEKQNIVSLAEQAAQAKAVGNEDEVDRIMLQMEALVLAKEEAEKVEARVAIETAEKLVGTENFLGPKEALEYAGYDFKGKIPEIPFSEEVLKDAEKNGKMLVLYPELSIEDMLDKIQSKMPKGEKFIYEDSLKWLKGDPLFEERMESHWALVSKEVTEGTTNKNYLEQTEVIADLLVKQYQGKAMPKEYTDAIAEFDKLKKDTPSLTEMVKSSTDAEWKKAAELLANLNLNQLTRETPAETLYRISSYYLKNKERLLSSTYSWSSRRDASGRLVLVGGFVSGGAVVSRGRPGGSVDYLGVSFSRSL